MSIKEFYNYRFCLKKAIHCLIIGSMLWVSSHSFAENIWSKSALISDRWPSLIQLSVASAGKRLVTVGERGSILYSDDNGLSWKQAPSPVSTSLTRVSFFNNETGWAVGHFGVILKTVDGGITWSKQFDGYQLSNQSNNDNAIKLNQGPDTSSNNSPIDSPENPLLAILVISDSEVMVAGAYGSLLKTNDGGMHWKSMRDKLPSNFDRHIYEIKKHEGSIYLYGEQGEILVSNNSESNFIRVNSPGKATIFGALNVRTAVLIYGLKGNVFRSEDSEKSWKKIPFEGTTVTAGIQLKNNSILLGNEAGQIYKSDDEGQTFTILGTRNPSPITELIQASDGTVIQVGIRGVSRIQMLKEEVSAK